jgi:hypothetical protein
MKVPVRYIRRQEIRLVIDLDDILALSQSKQDAVLDGIKAKGILESLCVTGRLGMLTPLEKMFVYYYSFAIISP